MAFNSICDSFARCSVSFADNTSFKCLYGRFTLFHFSVCKADAILKELRPLVENKEDISVSIILKRT